MYDVGAIARDIQLQFRLVCPPGATPVRCAEGTTNLATPENVAVLLDELSDVTDAVQQEVSSHELPPVSLIGWVTSMQAWRARLDAYKAIVDAAPPGDRAFISNDVTAPLLLGYYPGQPERKTIDAVSPFMLANQQQVADAFREELWESFLQDLKDNAADIVKPLAAGFGFGALALGGLALVIALRK